MQTENREYHRITIEIELAPKNHRRIGRKAYRPSPKYVFISTCTLTSYFSFSAVVASSKFKVIIYNHAEQTTEANPLSMF